jgi:outer membrane protein TolC
MTFNPLLLMLLPALLAAAEPLTLRKATEQALAGNPRLLAAKLDALAAQRRSQQSFARRFGDLDLVGQYNHFNDNRTLRPISKELLPITVLPFDSNQVHYGLAWQIPLLAGGSLREGDHIARLSQGASEKLALHTRAEIRYNTRAAYRNALTFRHATQSALALVKALEADMEQAYLLVKVGRWAAVDAAKVDYSLQEARSRLADLQARTDTADATLAALMGQDPPAQPFDLVDQVDLPAPTGIALTGSNAAAGSTRQDLLATQDATAMAERRKRLSQWSFTPQLSLSGSYLRNTAPSVTHSFDTHDFNVNLRIPIFDGGRRLRSLQEADANLAAARERERAKSLEVQAQVREAQGRLQASAVQFEAGKAQRSLGREVARVEHLKLEQGAGRVEDYLGARAQELAGETAYWQGLYAYQSAADYLDFATGKVVDHD